MTKKKKKKSMSGLLLVIIMLVVFVLSRSYIADFLGSANGAPVTFAVDSGAGASSIAAKLYENGIIEHPVFFRIMSKLQGFDGKYKEGSFNLFKDMGYNKIFDKLSGVPDSMGEVKITIPEGYEFRQIADILEENGLINQDTFYDLAQNHDFGYDFLADIPNRENRLEGYLFPDTYIFDSTSTELSILNTMLSRFNEIFTEEYKARAKELQMTTDEIITLASVIEREAQGDNDRDKVASVFHNRLKSQTYPYLESCATVQYILKERKTVLSNADTKIDSPYNTYMYPGLPVGPIASPGAKAIKSALYPENTDYLFFVLDSSNTHKFATTFEEHIENTKR
ncbi:MAG: endolytic transglycosylase MltG [Clostridia bacterium]|nr:endolytic transglycosylase MltG [Clostridia bacterium]